MLTTKAQRMEEVHMVVAHGPIKVSTDIKMLAVYTNDIFDQNNFVNLTRTSLCNSRKLLKDLFFTSQNNFS